MIQSDSTRRVILLVDDEPNVLRALRREILMAFGQRDVVVRSARSGPECLAILEEEPVALVISDYRMPEMDGAELLARVRAAYPRVVRMLLTAYSDGFAPEAASDARLMKPWNADELVAHIEGALSPDFVEAQSA